jgi:NitT/TauT family transport system permease protein/sulfonate transport system permease protein
MTAASSADGRLAGTRRAVSSRSLAAHGFTAAMLVAWQLASLRFPPYLLPGPVEVAKSLAWLLATPAGLAQVAASLFHIAAAMVLAFICGTAIAILPYYVRVLRLAIDGRLTPFLNAFPGIGWTLIAIIWFGLGLSTVIFAVAVILVPFTIVNIREGVRAIDAELIEMAESFSGGRLRRFSLIVLPSLLPFMFAAIRVSFGVSWKVALTAELFGGTRGLGYTMNIARQELETSRIFAVIALIVAITFLGGRLVFDPLQRRLQLSRMGL